MTLGEVAGFLSLRHQHHSSLRAHDAMAPNFQSISAKNLTAIAVFLALSSFSTLSITSDTLADQSDPGLIVLRMRTPNAELRNILLANGHPIRPDKKMQVSVYLTVVHPEQFNRVLSDTENPNSPMFDHQLTPADLKEFAWPDSEYLDIEQWLTSYGAEILSKDEGPFVRTITFQGTAAQFEGALHIRINQSADDRWFANMSEPLIPARFNGVIAAFAGLDNLRGFGRAP